MAMAVDRERRGAAPLARLLAIIVLVLMAAAVLYTGWIAVANVNRIGV